MPTPPAPAAAPPAPLLGRDGWDWNDVAAYPSFMGGRLDRRDAVSVLTVWAILLFGLPSRLIIGPLGYSITPATFLGFVAALWWAHARLVPGLGVAQGPRALRRALLLFVGAVLASYAYGMIHPIAGAELRAADRGLMTVVAGLGIALVAADGIHRPERLDTLLRRLILLASFLAALGLLQFFTGVDVSSLYRIPGLTLSGELNLIGERASFRRVAGTAAHPIEFGMVLALVLPIALQYAFAAERGHTRRRWAVVALLGAAILMSLSRSAILGSFAGGLVLFAGWPRERRIRALLVTPVFAIGIQLIVPGLIGTLRSLFVNLRSDPSYLGRTQDYDVVGTFISESPWLGRGFGTFLPNKYVLLDNQYLGTLIELGGVGLTAVILLLVVALASARNARRKSAHPFVRETAQSLTASVTIAAVGFVTFDAFGFAMFTGLLFVLLGCCGALSRLAETPALQPRRTAAARSPFERQPTGTAER